MNRTDKTAAELISDLRRLQAQYDACKCVGCKRTLRTYMQSGVLTGECKNKQCRRVDVTLEVSVLQTLSNADLDRMKYPDYSIKLAKVG